MLPQALDKARGANDVARANIQRTQTLLDVAKITAPFPGVVTMRFMDNGAFVPAATSGSAQNAAMFTVMDYRTIRVQAAVPELDAALAKAGQPVKVTLEALGGKTFEATATRFAHAIDARDEEKAGKRSWRSHCRPVLAASGARCARVRTSHSDPPGGFGHRCCHRWRCRL